MKFRLTIQPRYILAATVLVAVLMVGTAVIELRQSREEMYHLMREEAVSLAEAIDRGANNALLSMDRIESLLAERLLNNAYYIARLDSLGRLHAADLAAFAEENGLFRINLFDRRGNRILSSHSPEPGHAALPGRYAPTDYIAPILSGAVDQLVSGVKDARVEDGQRFAVAVRRTNPAGGAVVVNINAAELLEFRRSVGIGKLIRDLSDTSSIVYVALQDSEGILAASGAVRELSSIEQDSTLRRVMTEGTTLTRVADFNGSDVFEIVRPFGPGDERLGVLRIALAMDEVRNAEARMNRRMIIMTLVVITIGVLSIIFLMAQQNYQAMEKKYTSIRTFTGNILAQMRDGVVTVDSGGTVTIFNARAAEMLGADGEAVQGRSLKGITEGPAAGLNSVFGQPDGTSEISIDRPDGTRRIAAVSLSTTQDEKGNVESRTAVLRDLTDARRLERETQRREKLSAMGELASGVAHEIRNPLNAIAMIAQRFGKEFTPRSGAKEYRTLTKVMQDEARRVNAIIRQFLSFARPPKLQPRRVAVAEFVAHVGSLFSAQAAEKGVRFTASAEGSPAGRFDSEQMTQALLNVLQNALDATPRGGTIELNAELDEGRTRFTIVDTGTGMPPSSLDKIFNLYFTTKAEGTGVGLAVTQQIVAQHGGTIDVASTEGKGTRFSIEIPHQPEESLRSHPPGD